MTIQDIIRFIQLVQSRRTTYETLVEFLFGETPPADHDFLKRTRIVGVTEVTRSMGYSDQPKIAVRESFVLIEFSVIVPTFNGVDRLRSTLDALIGQTGIKHQDYEVIVVDDGSTEKSKALVDKYIKKYPERLITYVYYPENRGPAFARNVGIKLSAGEFVCFTDDDCDVPPDWLTNFRRAFQDNPEVAGVGGWYKPLADDGRIPSVFSRFLFWESLPYTLWEVKSLSFADNCAGNTANVCYRKPILEKIGGFNYYFPFASSEDWELKIRFIKARFPLLYQPKFARHRKGHLPLSAFVRLYLVRGFAGFLLYKIHPGYTAYHRTLSRSLGQCFIHIAELFTWRYRLPDFGLLKFSYLFVPLNFLKYALLCAGKYGLILWDRPITREQRQRRSDTNPNSL